MKYIFNPIFVVLGYTLLLCSLLFYTNPFTSFINPSFFILIALFLMLRFIDDNKDYYEDKLEGKSVLSRTSIRLLLLGSFLVLCLISLFYQRMLFVVLALFLLIIYALELNWLKPFIVSGALALVIFYEFKFHYSNALILGLSFILSVVFGIIKKEKVQYTLEEIGGKAYNLWKLNIKNTPAFYPIKAEYLNPPNKEKLEAIVEMFCKKNKLYAVRSSAIDEDSAATSFAGVHDTFLNVKKEEVLEKILEVVESAHSEVALNYRKENHLDTENIQIAVLLQEMVTADYAGVLNTINPVTNNISETVISVTEGLGDKLVDGTVDGTTYYVDSKKTDVNGPDILNKKVLKNLIKLADELRAKTNRFQDCEFAIKKDKVYFLQSRAITTYDVDTHKMTLLIDNSNLIESYYGVTSPLTHSFAHEIYTKVYTETCKVGKLNKKTLEALKPTLDNMLYSYEGKLYYNLNSWYNLTSIFPSKNSTTYMESMMGVKTDNKNYKKVKLSLIELIRLGICVLGKFKNIDKLSDIFVENFNTIVNPYYGKSLEGLSTEELTKLYEEIDSKIIKEFTTPILNDIGVMMNFGRLKEKVKKYPDSEELLAFAVNNNGNVESAKSATEFIKIVDAIKSDENVRKDFEIYSEEYLYKLYYEDTNKISSMIRAYIYGFGSRVMNELKLETITMIENPNLIFTLIKDALKNEKTLTPTASQIVIPKKLEKLSAKARHFIQNRERLRLRRTYVFSVIRNIFIACGKNLEKEGKISNHRDVFYLTKDEIFYGKKDFDYKARIEQRKAEEERNKLKPYYSRIAFYDEKVLPITFINPKGLKGLPSGKGKITEKVCVMETKDSDFIPGSIIVTKRTDPGWISLFPLAGGLIVEHGSMLSHSFVVAREMGLPCVVGVEGITSMVKTGDVVTLDALKGEITIETN